jgi:hypothetical protein
MQSIQTDESLIQLHLDTVTLHMRQRAGTPPRNVQIPLEDILKFVANYVAEKKIEKINKSTDQEILGLT